MSSTKPVRYSWLESVHCSTPRDTYEFKKIIYTCRARDPPSRITADVDESCRLKTDSPISIANIQTSTGVDGKEYKDVPHDVEMKVIGTAVEFAIIYDDKFVGRSQLTAEVEDLVLSTPAKGSSQNFSLLSPPQLNTSNPFRRWDAVALFDYSDVDDSNHSFKAGDKLRVTGTLPEVGWVLAEKDGMIKAAPENFIAPV